MSNSGGGREGINTGQGLPDLSQLRQQLSGAGISDEVTPNPENFMIALAMMTGSTEFRVPVDTISEIQQGLARGQFVFRYQKVSALQSQSGSPEWAILVAPTQAYVDLVNAGEDVPRGGGQERGVSANMPPGYVPPQGDTSDPDVLEIKAQGQGVKREYSWAELQEWSDEALAEVGVSREQVDLNAALAQRPESKVPSGDTSEPGIPKSRSYVDMQEAQGISGQPDDLPPASPGPEEAYSPEAGWVRADPEKGIPSQSAADYLGQKYAGYVEVDPEHTSGD